MDHEMELDTQPHLQHSLGEIFRQSEALRRRGNTTNSVEGAYFLAQTGFDIAQLSSDVQNVARQHIAYTPAPGLPKTDVDKYLEHVQQQAVVAAIETSLKSTRSRFNKELQGHMMRDWDKTKEDILNSLAVRPFLPSQAVPQTPGFAPASTPFHTPGRSGLSDTMASYARVVMELNNHRLHRRPYGLVTKFYGVAESVGRKTYSAETRDYIIQSWRLLKTMVGESNVDANGGFTRDEIPESSFSSYLDDGASQQQRLVQGSVHYFEERYQKKMRNFAQNCNMEISGDPSTLEMVRTYIFSNKIPLRSVANTWAPVLEEMYDSAPVWPQIYLLIRCGKFDEAIDVAQRVPSLNEFTPLLAQYCSGQGVPESAAKDLNDSVSTHTKDPFKILVYSIVAQSESKYAHLAKDGESTIFGRMFGVEDYIWYHLSLISPQRRAEGSSTLTALQNGVRDNPKIGAHDKKPLLKFSVLLAAQLFEHAIEYLMRFEHLQVEATHFAIALNYYGLLRTDYNCNQADMTMGAKVKLTSRIDQYTLSFSRTNVEEALNYYYLLVWRRLRLGDDILDTKQFKMLLQGMLFMYRDFDTLLGTSLADGTRSTGLVDKFHVDDVKRFIIEIADVFEDKADYDGATKLFDLAQNYTKVVELLVEQVGAQLPERRSSRDREVIVQLMQDISRKYSSNTNLAFSAQSLDGSLQTAFRQLRELIVFYDFYDDKKFEEAHQVISQLNIIPFTTVYAHESYAHMHPSIKRNFNDIVLKTMEILHKLYSKMRESVMHSSPVCQENMRKYREEAKALVTFSMRVSPQAEITDFSSRLIHLQSQMN